MYANHGALQKHHHKMEGIISRMDGLQWRYTISKAAIYSFMDRTTNCSCIFI